VRAAAAFSALVNVLVIALVGLLPGASLGDVGIILAGAGLATTFALVIVLYREHKQEIRHDVSGIDRQGGLAILFFLFGIARSWQLVGARAMGLTPAVTTVIQRPSSQGPPQGGGDATAGGEAGLAPGDP
jgi:hypothetical protein